MQTHIHSPEEGDKELHQVHEVAVLWESNLREGGKRETQKSQPKATTLVMHNNNIICVTHSHRHTQHCNKVRQNCLAAAAPAFLARVWPNWGTARINWLTNGVSHSIFQCEFVMSLAAFILHENMTTAAAAVPAAQKGGEKQTRLHSSTRGHKPEKRRIKIAHFTVIIIRAIVRLLLLRPNQGCRGQHGARKNASTTATVKKKM